MQRAGYLDALRHAEPAGHELVGGHARADRKRRASGVANRPEHLGDETQPGVKRTVVAVIASVAERRQKLGRQVAVGDRDLDPVEPAFARVACPSRVASDQLADLGHRERPRF